jgi:hypothetical protein
MSYLKIRFVFSGYGPHYSSFGNFYLLLLVSLFLVVFFFTKFVVSVRNMGVAGFPCKHSDAVSL